MRYSTKIMKYVLQALTIHVGMQYARPFWIRSQFLYLVVQQMVTSGTVREKTHIFFSQNEYNKKILCFQTLKKARSFDSVFYHFLNNTKGLNFVHLTFPRNAFFKIWENYFKSTSAKRPYTAVPFDNDTSLQLSQSLLEPG